MLPSRQQVIKVNCIYVNEILNEFDFMKRNSTWEEEKKTNNYSFGYKKMKVMKMAKKINEWICNFYENKKYRATWSKICSFIVCN